MLPTSPFALCCQQPPFFRFCITRPSALLGRAPDCDLVVDDASVSRRHAEIHFVDTKLRIVDVGSRNGTFVENSQIQTSFVELGQLVRFGAVVLVVDHGQAALEVETDDPALLAGQRKAGSKKHKGGLSEAQRRVFNFLREGLSDKTIARHLNLSPHTIHNHTREIFKVFRVHSRAQLLAVLAKTSGGLDAGVL
jgi:DNA-binding CsgD family transcriptional regulator